MGRKARWTLPPSFSRPSAGVFAGLSDPSLFKQVFIEHGAVTWPGEIDLAPDAMYAGIKKGVQ